MSDGTKVKLNLPPWHIPYLEKHKIMELLHELSRELIIQQPVDHLMFVKQILETASKSIGISRVVMLSSPEVNCLEVATQIARQTKHEVITEYMVLTNLNVTRHDLKPNALAMCLSYLLHSENAQNHGWILVDCIKTAEEAKRILQTGIIPTHVLHLIPPFTPPLRDMLYCGVHESWPAYRRQITALRDVFKDKVFEIFLQQRFIHEVVDECIEIIKIMKKLGCPKQLRVLILGPRGSGRNTQAHLIAQKLNLVHVNFHNLLCQAWNAEGELSDELRACERNVCLRPDLLCKVLNKKILEEDCLRKGWVLTGYPFNEQDFKFLDCLDTPPNRVIFLECDLSICKERITNKRVNAYTGSQVDIAKSPELADKEYMKIYPRDSVACVEAEMAYYCEQYGAMRNYCGETAQVINADQPERWVFESILSAIAKENLNAPPRNPCLQEDKEKVSDSSTVELTPELSSSPEPTQILSCYLNKTGI